MKYSKGAVLLAILVLTIMEEAPAQTNALAGVGNIDNTLTLGSPFPTLLADQSIDGADYIEATLDIERDGASVSWAPFLLTKNYIPVLSESRIQLSTLDGVTSLGLSIRYNPIHPRGPLAKEIQPKGVDPDQLSALIDNKRAQIKYLEEQEFSELTAGASPDCGDVALRQLESAANLGVTEPWTSIDKDLLRCSLAYARLKIEEYGSSDDTADQKKKWSEHYNEAEAVAERIYIAERGLQATGPTGLPAVTRLTLLRQAMAALEAEVASTSTKRASMSYQDFREKLMGTRHPTVTISHVSSFFEVIGDGNFDSDNDGNNDNEFSVKSRAFSLAADWRITENNQFSAIVSRSEERAAAEAGNELADYDGWGVTWAYRAHVFNENGYRKSKDYLESLFVPSINVGIALESRQCESSDDLCADGVLRTRSITPFVDFRLNKKAQFRLGVPYKESRVFISGQTQQEDAVELRATVSVQFGAPD